MPSPLRLVPVTSDNVEDACALKVRPDQDGLVKPVAWSLAQAYATPATAWPRLIVDGEQLVGFVMAFLDVQFHPEQPDDRLRSGLWRLNIAAEQQARGYGRFAVEAVNDELRRRGQTRTTVSYVPGAHGPEEFYRKLGFRTTGELSGDQVVAELELGPAAPRP
ncbi:GNAT family N-acetyltransferase [Streptomyces sp. NBC_01260]|uniref:GNAT family N-acetyltransferase n=1 Tax=Streptomyces TaxID=1883 RepID=UPI001A950673|nr:MULTISPECIES: GNAT family N-acetyltransferase [Streptomyces]MBO0913174.1 GNAT family N-acetyltransferase [Streptomyces laculatispora]MCX4772337.1 GNAT family N-acetyltransferase [Streptomyces sp. NBC_01285]